MEATTFYNDICQVLASNLFVAYIYPIIGSLFAALIFWILFSYIPERKKKRSFDIIISNDLFLLHSSIFSLFDLMLKANERSPSYFQHKISACSLSREDIEICLQNKARSIKDIINPQHAKNMIFIKDSYLKNSMEIEKTINKIYTLNYYLSAAEVSLLRNINETVFRYVPYLESIENTNTQFKPTNPSLSFMTNMLLDLQRHFSILSEIVFETRINTRNFYIKKIQYLFHKKSYKNCIKFCNEWIKDNPHDSILQHLYIINCEFELNNKNESYEKLKILFSENKIRLIDNRTLLHPLISDPIALKIIIDNTSYAELEEMKKIIENEKEVKNKFIYSNTELNKFKQ